MLALIAALIAAGCIAASYRRLAFALDPAGLDLSLLSAALRGEEGRARARALASRLTDASGGEGPPPGDAQAESWLTALLRALRAPGEARAAEVNEQLRELDFLARRWARVPRVCASIASSSGLLLAALALRDGLDVAIELPQELRDAAIGAAVSSALSSAAIGVAAATFCIAVQMRARRAMRECMEAADKLVERLEVLVETSSLE